MSIFYFPQRKNEISSKCVDKIIEVWDEAEPARGGQARGRTSMLRRVNLNLQGFRGSIIGVAVGDAKGLPVEGSKPGHITRHQLLKYAPNLKIAVPEQRNFKYSSLPALLSKQIGSKQEVDRIMEELEKYLPENIDDEYLDTPRLNLGPGQWSDDTILTRAQLRYMVQKRSERLDMEELREKMKQDYLAQPNRGFGKKTIETFAKGEADPYSAGCGITMRIAPAGLYYSPELDDLDRFREGIESIVRITHLEQRAIDGALAVAYIIASSVRGELEPHTAIQRTVDFIGGTGDMVKKLLDVQHILNSDVTDSEAYQAIGTSCYILESTGTAVYAFLKSPKDFRRTVLGPIRAGGDTDTNASIAAGMSGAFNGLAGIPKHWIAKVEAGKELDELASSLYRIVSATRKENE